MLTIIIQKFKEQYKGILYYFLGLFLYTWMIVGLYPSISRVKADYLQQMPTNLLKFFGGDVASIMTATGFLSLEFLSLFFILIIAFYIGSAAGSTIAGQIEKKTMDFQLSQPVSRTKLVLSETILGLCNTFILTALTTIAIYLFAKLYNVPISNSGLIAFAVTAIAFLWSIYGIGLFFSSILRTKITVASATVSLTMAFYIFSSMTRMVDKLSKLDKCSLFYLYDPQKLLDTGKINLDHILILAAIFIVGLISSLIIFNKKDI